MYDNCNSIKNITREEFMNFFRCDNKLNLLSPADREEIFSQILLGSSNITKNLLDELLSDYSVEHLEISEIANIE